MMARVVLAASCLLAAASAGAGIFPYPVHNHTLDNQMKVIMVPMPSDGLVSYYTIVRTGSRDEVETGHTGFAHFFEHMMFRGTENIPAAEYERLVTEMGADGNAYTTDDYTAYHMSFTAEDLPTVIRIEADRFQHLSYEESVFQTEAGAVYGEFRKNRTSPFFILYEGLIGAAFNEHTYGHSTMGYEADIAAMPTMFDYSLDFFRRFYRPDNVVVMIAGDFDPETTLETIKEHYGDWQPGYEASEVMPEPEQTEDRTVLLEYDGKTLPIVGITWKAPAFDPDNMTMVAGSLIPELAFGQTTALYQKLVLETQMAQMIQADASFNRDPTIWGVFGMVNDREAIEAMGKEVEAAIGELRTTLIDPDRLEAAKKRARYQALMGLDTPANVAGGMARFIAVTGGIEQAEAYLEKLATVTAEDLRAAANEIFDETKRTVAVVEPKAAEPTPAEPTVESQG